MKEYRHYQCEYNHGWVFMRESDSEELSEDTICPWGHEAIVLRRRTPTKFLQVSLRPAEESDDFGKISLSNRFYLVLTDVSMDRERMSKQTFLLDEASELLKTFYNLSVEQGWNMMDKMEKIHNFN